MNKNAAPWQSPNVSRKLRSPAVFDSVINRFDDSHGIHLLLRYLGFKDGDEFALTCQIENNKGRKPYFDAQLVDHRLPSAAQNGFVLTAILGDEPTMGVFKVIAMINFHATDAEIKVDFMKWLKEEKILLKRRRWSRQARNSRKFLRDLVIYCLSTDKTWSTEDIERQLRFMNLPSLATTLKTNAKNERKKVVFNIRKLIANANSWLELHRVVAPKTKISNLKPLEIGELNDLLKSENENM